MTSSRLPIGVAQTASVTGARPRLEREQAGADHTRLGAELGLLDPETDTGGSASSDTTVTRRPEDQLLAGAAEAPADATSSGSKTLTSREACSEQPADPVERPLSVRLARACGGDEGGAASSRVVRPRSAARPETSVSKWPRPGQAPPHGGPSTSTTM